MYRFLQTQQARGSIVMVALARMQRAGGESLGDALPFQLHNLLATRPEISRQGFQASTDFAGKCRRVHVPLYLQHPGCEVLTQHTYVYLMLFYTSPNHMLPIPS